MQKRIAIAFFATLLSSITQATIKPIVTVSTGVDTARVGLTQNIVMIAPLQNTYKSTHSTDSEMVGGVFIGMESSLCQKWLWQLGLSTYQAGAFVAHGTVYQFSDPAYNNLLYTFKIQTHPIYAETKILFEYQPRVYTYFIAGLGTTRNNAFGYTETPVTSDDVPMQQPFGNHSTQAFTYTLGIGLDVVLGPHLRIGGGYRFADLGRAGLSTSSLQTSTTTLSYNHLYTQQVLLQMSYVG